MHHHAPAEPLLHAPWFFNRLWRYISSYLLTCLLDTKEIDVAVLCYPIPSLNMHIVDKFDQLSFDYFHRSRFLLCHCRRHVRSSSSIHTKHPSNLESDHPTRLKSVIVALPQQYIGVFTEAHTLRCVSYAQRHHRCKRHLILISKFNLNMTLYIYKTQSVR